MGLLYYNGVIYTLASGTVSAMAVEGECIVAVGSDEAMVAQYEGFDRIDLGGKCVVPGFNDSHCHLLATGMGCIQLDLRDVRSVAELVERGHAYIAKYAIPEGQWVFAYGYDHNRMSPSEIPDRAAADAISTKHPILLNRVCGHVGTVNSLAIERMGVHSGSMIEGGSFDVGEDGNLNGVLRETALYFAMSHIPRPSVEQIAEALRVGMAMYNRCGVTSVQSDDLESIKLDDLEAAIALLRRRGQLTIRLNEEIEAPHMQQLQAIIDRGLKTGAGDDWYRIGNIKLITDGSLGTRTAYIRAPYEGDAQQGIRVYSDEELQALVMAAHKAGLQLAFHAIGDGAAEQCIHAVELAQSAEPKDLRHRLVHGQVLGYDLIERLADARMAVDIQPPFVASDWPMVIPTLDDARAKYAYCWRKLLERGIAIAGGSDSPVESVNPLWGIGCAVTRMDADGEPKGGFQPEEKLSPLEALQLYTMGGAFISLEEQKKGVLAPGMLADFAVLSDDPLRCAQEYIQNITVVMTVIGGQVCHRASMVVS